jgi:predicted secreted protein
LREALDDLPNDLNELYSRILERMPKRYEANAIRVLQFPLYSREPLTVEELVDAIAVKPDESVAFDPNNRMPKPTEIATFCSSLMKIVTIDAGNRSRVELHLAHFTVQEYLLKYSAHSAKFAEIAARASLAIVCMSYLRHVDLKWPDNRDETAHIIQLKTRFPFIEYSSQNWMSHAAATECENDILEKTTEFLTSCNKVYLENWTAVYGRSDYYEGGESLLWYACTGGSNTLCLQRLDIRICVGLKSFWTPDDNNIFSEPLREACEAGDLRWISFLLENGGRVASRGGNFQTPCKNGNEAAVETMLKHGASLADDSGNECGHSAFILACQYGHQRIAEILIEHDQNYVNFEDRYGGMPLYSAIQASQDDIALILIKNGARPSEYEYEQDDWTQARQFVIEKKLEKTLQKIIEDHPEELESRDFEIAAATGSVQIMRILCETEKLQGGSLEGALSIAAERKHVEVKSLLLETIAQLNRGQDRGFRKLDPQCEPQATHQIDDTKPHPNAKPQNAAKKTRNQAAGRVSRRTEKNNRSPSINCTALAAKRHLSPTGSHQRRGKDLGYRTASQEPRANHRHSRSSHCQELQVSRPTCSSHQRYKHRSRGTNTSSTSPETTDRIRGSRFKALWDIMWSPGHGK